MYILDQVFYFIGIAMGLFFELVALLVILLALFMMVCYVCTWVSECCEKRSIVSRLDSLFNQEDWRGVLRVGLYDHSNDENNFPMIRKLLDDDIKFKKKNNDSKVHHSNVVINYARVYIAIDDQMSYNDLMKFEGALDDFYKNKKKPYIRKKYV